MTVPFWQEMSVYLDRCEDAGQDTVLGRAYVLLLRGSARTLRVKRAAYGSCCDGAGGGGGSSSIGGDGHGCGYCCGDLGDGEGVGDAGRFYGGGDGVGSTGMYL